ncbi:MAG: CRISPR-associated helicase Cas3' [Lachnospiraceae bacterium]|jgi:CRISPR-associated endonuclease/helicase Cas3|nr:CRISPR-associated helicase Cas3' [Lachnospiraceae bacterium]MCI1657034.1 CRISPR-associated helicase Cas3' [Lachnospiraceae bacterium]MCI2195541.1 CRISPR-associated helicase Cas3' [Lachnospiraceae bacterium]
MDYIAHVRQNDKKRIQTVRDHCVETSEICKKFSIKEMEEISKVAGLFHDVGKYQRTFQRRIRGEKVQVDHSTCGAIAVHNEYNMPARLLLEYIIAGHHAGIPNGGIKGDVDRGVKTTLYGRLERKVEDFSAYKIELEIPEIDNVSFSKFLLQDCDNAMWRVIDKFTFLTRLGYSSLVDADSLDTETFITGHKRETLHSDYSECLSRLNRKLESFSCETKLQKSRSKLQVQAYKNITENAEIYLMNMPTGSGKTLCGTKCALIKALQEGKRHIIYIIPYNSIITQTVQELKKVFGDAADILRHQSTYAVDDEDVTESYKISVNQATENWDADIIITTTVQFFETCFSNKRSKLRKMHNMTDSILVFDEAHLMPLEYLQPCLETIVFLSRYCNSKTILLTATMPKYEDLIRKYTFKDCKVIDLIPDKKDFVFFGKCVFRDLGFISVEKIYQLTFEVPSVLIVVNSRKKARKLYEDFSGGSCVEIYHLSTYMTKYDLQRSIDEIRQRLKNDEPTTVISTSLIEAGVDLDFYTAFREYTGLDSIIQTGGRCNREGKRRNGNVFIFGFEENENSLTDIKTSVTCDLLHKYADITSQECIEEYYLRVYLSNEYEITKNTMYNKMQEMGLPGEIMNIPFADYNAQLIEDEQVSIVIPQNEDAIQLTEKLKYVGASRKLLHSIQKYTCSVRCKEFETLLRQGVLDDYGSGVFVLTNLDYYSSKKGIMTEGNDYFL